MTFKKAAPEYPLVTLADEDDTVKAIRGGSEPISPSLASAYASNLQSAVGSVLSSADGDIAMAAKANVSKLAYFKAAQATSQVRAAATNDDALKELNKFNRWQATEYNTAVARARSAKQWQGFERTKEFLPNLRWVQSRSVNPREEHVAYWGRVWAKDDPFWAMNQPGNAFGCKCDWEETNDPVTRGNLSMTQSASPGMQGNPGVTGEVFSDDHNYIKTVADRMGGSDKAEALVNSFERSRLTKEVAKEYDKDIICPAGRIKIDKQSVKETAQTDIYSPSYYLKSRILTNFSQYAGRLEHENDEPIDISHNNKNGKAARRKRKFEKMKKYSLKVGEKTFVVKAGQYKDGTLALYSIHE